MCRFVLYVGEEMTLDQLVTEPSNSIINQSFHSREREEPLNGDGFGVAAYVRGFEDRPARLRTVTPAWSNRNLRELARVFSSGCILAHVRAASPGLPVTELNCHPFVWKNLAFMHNGVVGGFATIRRRLLRSLSDTAFDLIEGSTDSEVVFAMLVDHYEGAERAPDCERLAEALTAAIRDVEAVRLAAGIEQDSLLNLAISDGRNAVVSRYTSGDPERANSLYLHRGGCYLCEEGRVRMRPESEQNDAVLVASEPLTEDGDWTPVPPNHLVSVAEDGEVNVRALSVDGFSA